MFAKLLKHEMKATAGSIGLLSLAALVMGVLGGFMMRHIVNAAGQQQFDKLSGILILLYVFVFFGLFAYALGSELFLAYQFYKRKFTDEGYLTFTLPAHSWQIFLSSMVNIMVWTLIIGLVTALAIGAILLIGIVGTPVWQELSGHGLQFPDMADVMAEFHPLVILYSIAQYVSSTVIMMTCITLGSVLAKKHKILASIGVYYGWSLVMGVITTQLLGDVLYMATELDFTRVYTIETILLLTVSMGGFLLSCWLMDKKLNLP